MQPAIKTVTDCEQALLVFHAEIKKHTARAHTQSTHTAHTHTHAPASSSSFLRFGPGSSSREAIVSSTLHTALATLGMYLRERAGNHKSGTSCLHTLHLFLHAVCLLRLIDLDEDRKATCAVRECSSTHGSTHLTRLRFRCFCSLAALARAILFLSCTAMTLCVCVCAPFL